MCIGGGGGGNAQADAARVDEDARKAAIAQGVTNINNTFGAFGNDFYKQREQSYSDYAEPQLDIQHDKAKRDLTYALSDAGTTRSSVAATRLGDLERDYGLQKLSVADQARGYADKARSDIEGARSGLISQVNATADATGAQSGALGQAQALAAAPTFSPLGQVFQNASAGVGALAKNPSFNTPVTGQQPAGGVKLYGNSGGSSRVVN